MDDEYKRLETEKRVMREERKDVDNKQRLEKKKAQQKELEKQQMLNNQNETLKSSANLHKKLPLKMKNLEQKKIWKKESNQTRKRKKRQGPEGKFLSSPTSTPPSPEEQKNLLQVTENSGTWRRN